MRCSTAAVVLVVSCALVTTASAAVFFYEDFEDPTGWIASGEINGQPGSLWHRDTHRAAFGSYSAAYNTGGPDWNYDVGPSWGLLASPVINLSGAPMLYLDFYSWLETENAPQLFDVSLVMLSPAGLPWAPFPMDLQELPQGQWNRVRIDLSTYAVNPDPFRVGFRFDSVDGFDNDFEGWYIDDVFLSDGDTAPVPEPSTLVLVSTGLLGAGVVLRRRIGR